jgi:hypothetical protein
MFDQVREESERLRRDYAELAREHAEQKRTIAHLCKSGSAAMAGLVDDLCDVRAALVLSNAGRERANELAVLVLRNTVATNGQNMRMIQLARAIAGDDVPGDMDRKIAEALGIKLISPLAKDTRCPATHAADFDNCPNCGDPELSPK